MDGLWPCLIVLCFASCSPLLPHLIVSAAIPVLDAGGVTG
jgi:hypothetical protein